MLGCKAFLVHSGIDEFPNSTEADLREAMPVLRDAGLPLLAHAELDLGAGAAARQDRRSYQRYLESRPKALGRRSHSAAREVVPRNALPGAHRAFVVRGVGADFARGQGRGLADHRRDLPALLVLGSRAAFRTAPPCSSARRPSASTRTEKACGARSLEGVIDFVITDHSPCTPALKLAERGDFEHAWGGIASLQLGLPAVWTEARRRGADLGLLFRWLSAAPARFAGLGTKKGRIAVGFEADLLVWDPDAPITVTAERLFFRHKVSPYLGQALQGRVQHTLLRGQCVYDGERHPEAPMGRPLLQREAAL